MTTEDAIDAALLRFVFEDCSKKGEATEIQLFDGRTYRGEVKNNIMHGEGIMKFKNGLVYEGEFDQGNMTGKGVYKWPNGDEYIGEVYDGQKHGIGCFKSANREISYLGEWKNGKKDGKGQLYFNKERTIFYDGEFENDFRYGTGVMVYEQNSVYEGEWKFGKKDGFGSMIWGTRGEEYHGMWKNDRPHGRGVHIQKTTSGLNKYEGEFFEGMKNGRGLVMFADGSKYEGTWWNDAKNGVGIVTSNTGVEYKANFVNDKMKSSMEPLTSSETEKLREKTRNTSMGSSGEEGKNQYLLSAGTSLGERTTDFDESPSADAKSQSTDSSNKDKEATRSDVSKKEKSVVLIDHLNVEAARKHLKTPVLPSVVSGATSKVATPKTPPTEDRSGNTGNSEFYVSSTVQSMVMNLKDVFVSSKSYESDITRLKNTLSQHFGVQDGSSHTVLSPSKTTVQNISEEIMKSPLAKASSVSLSPASPPPITCHTPSKEKNSEDSLVYSTPSTVEDIVGGRSLSMGQYWKFIHDFSLLTNSLSLAECDRIFIQVLSTSTQKEKLLKGTHSPDSRMYLRHFLEALVRIAVLRKDSSESPLEKTNEMIENNIIPNRKKIKKLGIPASSIEHEELKGFVYQRLTELEALYRYCYKIGNPCASDVLSPTEVSIRVRDFINMLRGTNAFDRSFTMRNVLDLFSFDAGEENDEVLNVLTVNREIIFVEFIQAIVDCSLLKVNGENLTVVDKANEFLNFLL